VADRLLDGWLSADTAALRDRHWFYLRHRRPFVIAWLVAAIPLTYLIFFREPLSVRTDDIVLCLIGVAYFFLIHGRSSQTDGVRLFPHWFPKELAVGFLFAIATAVPTWTEVTEGHSLSMGGGLINRSFLIAAIFTFGAACWLNCVAIQVWEDAEANREVIHTILAAQPKQESTTRYRDLTESLGKHLTAFAISVGAVSLGFAALTAKSHFYPLFLSLTFSAVLFLALIRFSQRFSSLSLRIAADAALLTPLLFVLLLR
jgi:hypothetical protein